MKQFNNITYEFIKYKFCLLILKTNHKATKHLVLISPLKNLYSTFTKNTYFLNIEQITISIYYCNTFFIYGFYINGSFFY